MVCSSILFRTSEGSTLKGVFGSCCYHCFFGDLNVSVVGKFLAVLLFADVGNERDQRVNPLVEFLEVGIKIRLINVTVAILDVV